jgi:hypothetical protein
VLEAVKARPGNVGVCLPGGATADLDSFCARRRSKSTVGAEESLRRGQTKERRSKKKTARMLWPTRSATKSHAAKKVRISTGVHTRSRPKSCVTDGMSSRLYTMSVHIKRRIT